MGLVVSGEYHHARDVGPEKFRGCSLLVGILPKYKFLCANTDVRGVERQPLPQPFPIMTRKKLSWDNLYQYLLTWSSLHTFWGRYPGREDISKELWDDLRKGMGRMAKGR